MANSARHRHHYTELDVINNHPPRRFADGAFKETAMAKEKKQDYRIAIRRPSHSEAGAFTTTFIVRKGDRVSYISGDETPLALANLVMGNAAELRFALEDVATGGEAADKVREVLGSIWRNNTAMLPRVDVL